MLPARVQLIAVMNDSNSKSQKLNKPLRLCILLPSHWASAMGGAEYQVKLLLGGLDQRQNIRVWYLARNINETFSSKNYEIRKIGSSKGSRFVLDTPGILRTLKEIEPDLIYSRVGTAYVGIAAAYCRHRPCKLVWHIARDDDVKRAPFSLAGGGMDWLNKKILEYGIRNADAIVAQTSQQAENLSKNYGISASTVISNFHPAPKEEILKSEPVKVLWIGNLKNIKQPDLFIKLASKLRDSGAQFIMVGSNQWSSEKLSAFQARVAEIENLSYIGAIEQDEVNSLLARSDILVNTSVLEGFSNTFIQAWMRGVPVVSLNSDPDRLLSESELGYYAQGKFSELETCTKELIHDNVARKRFAYHCRNFAYRHFGLDRCDDLIDFIERLATINNTS